MTFQGFTPDTFAFFTELEVNNNKTWWEANKARHEQFVRRPVQALLDEFGAEFGSGKLYRPYRDTRFSADKTPYKDRQAMAVFGPGATGIYLEVSARGLDIGGGYWHPGKDQVDKFRELVDDVRYFGDLEATVEELEEFGFSLYQADALKTAPRGFAPDHPRIHLLRLKHLVVERIDEPAEWMYSPEAADEIVSRWRQVGVWNEWLLENIGPSEMGPRPR